MISQMKRKSNQKLTKLNTQIKKGLVEVYNARGKLWREFNQLSLDFYKVIGSFESSSKSRGCNGCRKQYELGTVLNPNWHELWKLEKCSSLVPSRSKFHKTQRACQRVKLSRLISIFTSKNIWKFLIKIQLKKSNPKFTRR